MKHINNGRFSVESFAPLRVWAVLLVVVSIVSAGVGQQSPPSGGVSSASPTQATQVDALERFRVASSGDVIGFSGCNASGTQTITLVHTGKSWMAVYHVGPEGEIQLVSSRPIDADFSLQLNVTAPLPDEIKGLSSR
ncbi:hypothetical protein OAL43_02100 [bacterium]|nr:hypothetical protein [Rubripirellula sp.]MDB4338610.1 hypothetical protein [Rubripirellula sp.]MDC0278975.1 hypothetical protein [bacterium]